MPVVDTKTRREYGTKIALSLIFVGLFGAFVGLMSRFELWGQAQLQFIDWILLGFATLRLGRLISYDLVMQPLRSPFTQTVADASGSGDTVKPKGFGIRRAIGEMLSCPICTGTWAAAFLIYALYLFPGPTRVFLVMTAAIGLAEILNALLESLIWFGEYARSTAGDQKRPRSFGFPAKDSGQREFETIIEEYHAREK